MDCESFYRPRVLGSYILSENMQATTIIQLIEIIIQATTIIQPTEIISLSPTVTQFCVYADEQP
jgi:hypothetical protein